MVSPTKESDVLTNMEGNVAAGSDNGLDSAAASDNGVNSATTNENEAVEIDDGVEVDKVGDDGATLVAVVIGDKLEQVRAIFVCLYSI